MWSGPVSGLRDDAQRAVLCRGPRDREQARSDRSEEHTSELQSPCNLVCRLLLEKKKKYYISSCFQVLSRCLTKTPFCLRFVTQSFIHTIYALAHAPTLHLILTMYDT